MNHIVRFFKEEDGISSLEYALIAILIAVAIVVGAGLLGTNLNQKFTDIANWLSSAAPVPGQ
jgi:pilus assembly protein Flp/PilA